MSIKGTKIAISMRKSLEIHRKSSHRTDEKGFYDTRSYMAVRPVKMRIIC